jgi:quercetin dioxygenase-like cupin family protein/DNA-binding transcriptional regulator YiaG
MSTVKDAAVSLAVPPHDQRVGEAIRALRVRQVLSVRTLAARAGFSPSFLSQVEHGQASPSIASLERIAAALGVSVGDFFPCDRSVTTAVVRSSGRPELTSAWSHATVEALGPVGGGRSLEAVMLTLDPGGRSGAQPFAHSGQEFAIVFEGDVRLTLGDAVHNLGRGDSATFPAETPHQWENLSLAPARVVIVSARVLR